MKQLIITYDHEEHDEFDIYVNAMGLYRALHEVRDQLRDYVKYDKEFDLDRFYEDFFDILREEGIVTLF